MISSDFNLIPYLFVYIGFRNKFTLVHDFVFCDPYYTNMIYFLQGMRVGEWELIPEVYLTRESLSNFSLAFEVIRGCWSKYLPPKLRYRNIKPNKNIILGWLKCANYRIALTKLRISNHKLVILKGKMTMNSILGTFPKNPWQLFRGYYCT